MLDLQNDLDLEAFQQAGQRYAELQAERAVQVERQRWFDAADHVLASFYARYQKPRDRELAREVWVNIREQAKADESDVVSAPA